MQITTMKLLVVGGFGEKWGGNTYKPGRCIYSTEGLCPTLIRSGNGYEAGASKLILEVKDADTVSGNKV